MEYRSPEGFQLRRSKQQRFPSSRSFCSHPNVPLAVPRSRANPGIGSNRTGARLERTNIVIDTVGHQQADVVRAKLETQLSVTPSWKTPITPAIRSHSGISAGPPWPGPRRRSRRLAPRARWQPGAVFEDRIQALIYGQLAESRCAGWEDFIEALPVCREGRNRFPQDAALLLAEGVVLAELGAPNEAAVRLHEVLRRDPGNESARAWLAKLQSR